MADRYWVGGTAAWDGTAGTKWALTSGGAGGQAVPTSADDVFFTNLSTGTCTISAGNTGAKSINCTGFTGTIAGSSNISVSGSVTLVAGMTFTYTGVISILDTGTLTSAGKTLSGLTINGSSITVTLGGNTTVATTGTTTLTLGTLDLAGFTLTTGIFSSSGTGVRQISFGTGNIALSSTTSSTTVLSMADATNFTWTGTGGFTRNQAATATVNFGSTSSSGTASNSPNLTVTAGSSQLSITPQSCFKNLLFTGGTARASAFPDTTVKLFGNLTLQPTPFYNFTPNFLSTATLTCNGNTIGVVVDVGAGTLTCADAMGYQIIFYSGTLKLAAGATSSLPYGLVTVGTNLKYLESTIPGVQATVSRDTSIDPTNPVTYLSIKDSNAIGGVQWDATSPTNVNAGNNSGWVFEGNSGGFFAVL